MKRVIKLLLNKIYYDVKHPAGLGSKALLLASAKKSNKKVTFSDVEEFLAEQDAYTLHKPVRNRFERRKILSRGLDNIWQIDLMDMSKIAKENKGNRYILVSVNINVNIAHVLSLNHISTRLQSMYFPVNHTP